MMQSLFLALLLTQIQGSERGSIGGTVANLTTGAPISGVTVNLMEPAGLAAPVATATSGNDGTFVFNNVRPGEFLVEASLNVGAGPPKTWGRYVTIRGGEQVNDVHVKFILTSTLTGRIVDSAGKPLPSMEVTLLQKAYDSDGMFGLLPVPNIRQVQTDAEGAYRLVDVWPGEYYISVARQPARGAQLTSYYPGELVPSRALSIAVPVNTEMRVNDFSPVSGDFSISFGVRDSSDPSGTGSYALHLDPRDTRPYVTANSLILFGQGYDEGTRIENLPPGSYDLYIRTFGAAPMGVQRLEINLPERDLDLGFVTIGPRVSISGRMLFSDGSPAELNVMLRPLPPSRGAHARALNTTSLATLSAAEREGRGDAVNGQILRDGTFVLNHVSEGQYRIEIEGLASRPELYIASARYGSQDVLSNLLVINGREPPGPLEIIIDGPAGTVQGPVRDERNEPVANAVVALVPEWNRRGNPDLFHSVKTDSRGGFSIVGVPPGIYSAFAWTKIPDFAYKNAEFLRDYEIRGVPVRVDRGSRISTDLRVIP